MQYDKIYLLLTVDLRREGIELPIWLRNVGIHPVPISMMLFTTVSETDSSKTAYK